MRSPKYVAWAGSPSVVAHSPYNACGLKRLVSEKSKRCSARVVPSAVIVATSLDVKLTVTMPTSVEVAGRTLQPRHWPFEVRYSSPLYVWSSPIGPAE